MTCPAQGYTFSARKPCQASGSNGNAGACTAKRGVPGLGTKGAHTRGEQQLRNRPHSPAWEYQLPCSLPAWPAQAVDSSEVAAATARHPLLPTSIYAHPGGPITYLVINITHNLLCSFVCPKPGTAASCCCTCATPPPCWCPQPTSRSCGTRTWG